MAVVRFQAGDLAGGDSVVQSRQPAPYLRWFAEAPFPMYQLAGWRGPCSVGYAAKGRATAPGPAGAGPAVSDYLVLGLVHGELESEHDPSLHVIVSNTSVNPATQMMAGDDFGFPTSEVEPVPATIDICGKPVSCTLVEGEQTWTAFADLVDHCVLLRARHLELGRVRLERVNDLSRYLAADPA